MTICSHESHKNSQSNMQPESSAPATAPVTPTESGSDTLSETSNEPRVTEFGGPKGPEPTRFGDWERKGRCVDF